MGLTAAMATVTAMTIPTAMTTHMVLLGSTAKLVPMIRALMAKAKRNSRGALRMAGRMREMLSGAPDAPRVASGPQLGRHLGRRGQRRRVPRVTHEDRGPTPRHGEHAGHLVHLGRGHHDDHALASPHAGHGLDHRGHDGQRRAGRADGIGHGMVASTTGPR
jgi:hypothetical protein